MQKNNAIGAEVRGQFQDEPQCHSAKSKRKTSKLVGARLGDVNQYVVAQPITAEVTRNIADLRKPIQLVVNKSEKRKSILVVFTKGPNFVETCTVSQTEDSV